MEIVIGLVVIGFVGWWFFLKDKGSSATPSAPYKVEAAPVVSEPVKVEESAPVVETPAPKAGGKAGKAPAAVAKAAKAPAKPKAEKKPAAPKAPKATTAKAPKAGGKASAPKNTVAK